MQSEQSQTTIPVSLESVSAQFEEWRKNKQANNTPKTKIPKILWQQVSALFNHYPLPIIKKTLNLNSRQLKSKFQKHRNNKNSIKKIKAKKPAFIPVNISVPQSVEKVKSNAIGKIELKRSDGIIMFIDNLNQQTLTQFMQGL